MISVIIPLYNKENSITDCINSVLRQTYSDFEIIVVNDGSTDYSLDIVSRIKDDRIVIFSKINGGVSDARNFGILKAQSENIFFLDADDLIKDNCLSIFVDLMNKYIDISFFVANFESVFGNNKIVFNSKGKEEIIQNPFKSIWNSKILPRTGSMLIKRKCFNEIGFFRTDISLHEDLELILRLVNKFKIAYTPKVVLGYQCDFNVLSKNNVPILKDFAYHSNLCNKSFFERLIISNNKFGSFRKRIKNGDKEDAKKILRLNFQNSLFILIVLVRRGILKFFKKIKY